MAPVRWRRRGPAACPRAIFTFPAIATATSISFSAPPSSAAKVPAEMLRNTNLVGPRSFVKERIAAYKEAGVTILSVNPVGGDAVKTVETLRELID